MKKKQILAWGAGVLALVLVTAGASALVTKEVMDTEQPAVEKTVAVKKTSGEKISWNEPRQQPVQQAQPARPPCQDGNIVGMALGGVGGGLVGNQIGKGSGRTAATIGGAVGGAYLGKEFIPTENVTCQ